MWRLASNGYSCDCLCRFSTLLQPRATLLGVRQLLSRTSVTGSAQRRAQQVVTAVQTYLDDSGSQNLDRPMDNRNGVRTRSIIPQKSNTTPSATIVLPKCGPHCTLQLYSACKLAATTKERVYGKVYAAYHSFISLYHCIHEANPRNGYTVRRMRRIILPLASTTVYMK